MNPLTLKRLGFVALLAAFIALFMIGGIWFPNTWLISPWFWLIDVGCLAASIVALIMWQIELAYMGIKLEPEDMIEDDEAAEKEMKNPATILKKQAASVPAQKAAVPAKPAAKAQAPAKAPAIAATQARPATAAKPASLPTKKPAQGITPKATATAKPAVVNPEQAKKDAAKLHDMFATSTEPSMQIEPASDEDKKFKVSKKIVFSMIQDYTDAGYTYFSFSKARKELGATNDKDALKIKKFLINACELNMLEKKGSKYFILY